MLPSVIGGASGCPISSWQNAIEEESLDLWPVGESSPYQVIIGIEITDRGEAKGAKAMFLRVVVIEECQCVFGLGPPSQMPLAMVRVCLGFEVHLIAKHDLRLPPRRSDLPSE